MELNKLKEEFFLLKQTNPSNSEELVIVSNKISSIGSILCKFFPQELSKINDIEDIYSLIDSAKNYVDNKEIDFSENKIKIYSGNKKETVPVISPEILVESLDSNWSSDEKKLMEMFFSDVNNFALINIAIYLQKK